MPERANRMKAFVSYTEALQGYEKGEAQVFCDRLFQAFGHEGYSEAGAKLEFQVKKAHGKGVKFADLIWRPRVLIEMKSRGEKLQNHYRQAFDYWIHLVPDRPRYVVLCNFDEFWIYDFNQQLDSPVDQVSLGELPDRYTALNFLFPEDPEPLFGNDKVKVTREAADRVAQVYNSIVGRGEDRDQARRYILQCVVAMFSEDFDLLPRDLFTFLLTDCIEKNQDAYDLIGGLFSQMANPKAAKGGRYKGVRYFDGGLFETVNPIELTREECELLHAAASEHWASVAPPVFGTLFQSSMEKDRRHALGAHFTNEADIQKVVLPSIIRPWRERVEGAKTLKQIRGLLDEILSFRVLDPACGSGNFLYVAYRELVNLELDILQRIHEEFGAQAKRQVGAHSLVRTSQFFGIDIDPFAVEVAKVTLMLAKRIALSETDPDRFSEQHALPLEFGDPLPLDNLDRNIIADDALFCDWPEADVIVGNPPFQSKNKIQQELGRAYVNRVRNRYSDVPGRADFCVYWFRRAHDEIPEGGRCGLVGTNTIRQNYSREGGLDYIVENGGAITEAVSTQVWSGDAAVHVSIVNWIKGTQKEKKTLFKQVGENLDSPWESMELDRIASSLSGTFDVTQASALEMNAESKTTYQGQTHGHAGFLLSPEAGEAMIAEDPKCKDVIFSFMTASDLLTTTPPRATRYAIDFYPRDVIAAETYSLPFARVKKMVLPKREENAAKEARRNAEALADDSDARLNHHHRNFLRKWWLFSYPRGELMEKLAAMSRYVACGQVTKRPVFVFLSAAIHPNAALQVFAFEDDYSFGVLQSAAHWEWFTERCSTLGGTFRYTSDTVYNSFPWPQSPSFREARGVAEAAVALRSLRRELLLEHGMTLRDLYRTLELPGDNPLKEAHSLLDSSVRAAYGMGKKESDLEFLFALNQEIRHREAAGKRVTGPGLPEGIGNRSRFVSKDCFEA